MFTVLEVTEQEEDQMGRHLTLNYRRVDCYQINPSPIYWTALHKISSPNLFRSKMW